VPFDHATNYLGLKLANPLVVAACPLTGQIHELERLELAGASAAVLPSLFAEQIDGDEESIGRPSDLDPVLHAPTMANYNAGPDGYLQLLAAARRAVQMPVIASLNATRVGRWVRFAQLLDDAGASALELNAYLVPTDPRTSGSEIERGYVELVQALRAETKLPLAVKLSPFVSSLPHLAAQLIAAGADGLVLFNRYMQPDVDLETLQLVPQLILSSRDELRLPLRWIGLLRRQLSASLAASTGVHFAEDAIKLLLVGADVVTMASAIIRHGPSHITTMLGEMEHWLAHRNFRSLADIRGLAGARPADQAALERANYAQAVTDFDAGE